MILLATFFGAVLRLLFIASPAGRVSADEAVFGLMALRIWNGVEYPIFIWGAHYAGALISYIAAPLVGIWGPTDINLKISTLPFALGTIVLGGIWGARLRGPVGALGAALLLAAPLPVFLSYSTMVLGGYTETYFFTIAVWILASLADAEKDDSARRKLWVIAGLLAGIATYIVWLILPALGAGVLAVISSPNRKKHLAAIWAALGGFFIGVTPLIAYNIIHPLASFSRAAGRSLGDTAFLHGATFTTVLMNALDELASPWGGLPAVGFAAAIVGWAAWRGRKSFEGRLIGFFLPLWLLFVLIGGFNRSRQWTEVYLVIVLALPLLPRFIFPLLVSAACLLNLGAYPAMIASAAPDYERLAVALENAGVRHVLTGYETAYRLMFYSGERLIASPLAGPNPTDRNPGYSKTVLSAPTAAIVLPEGRMSQSFAGAYPSTPALCFEGYCSFLPETSPEESLGIIQKFRD